MKPPITLWLLAALVLTLLAGCTGRQFVAASGWSGVAVGGDMVYVGTRSGRVLALDTRSGNPRFAFPPEGQDPLEGLYGTPALVDGVLYVGSYDSKTKDKHPKGKVFALNASDLSEKWKYPNDVTGIDRIVGGITVTQGGLVLFGASDGFVRALRASNGFKEWEFKTDKPVWSTPTVAGDTVYVGSLDHNLYALSLASGEPMWASPFSAGGAIVSTPAVAGDKVFVGSFDRKLYAVDAATGREAWRFQGEGWFWSSPVSQGKRVYAADTKGVLYALDMGTGREVWRSNLEKPVLSSPVIVEGNLVVATDGGIIYVLSLATGAQVSSYNVGAQVQAPLTANGQTVYVNAMDKRVWALRMAGRQEKVWETNTDPKK
ncbi:MAG: PQQ-binding-like beta-propeller repeat protein [Chloroflexi bacterium]|nr:PQQ-binding-like beta-propeller repeat protein [Chloroflexota bacterium]